MITVRSMISPSRRDCPSQDMSLPRPGFGLFRMVSPGGCPTWLKLEALAGDCLIDPVDRL